MSLSGTKFYKSNVFTMLHGYEAEIINKRTGEVAFRWPELPTHQVAQWVIEQWLREHGDVDVIYHDNGKIEVVR